MDDTPDREPGGLSKPYLWCVAALTMALGALSVAGGIWLLLLGGSPYYLVVGAALVIAAVLIGRAQSLATWLFALIIVATVLWSLLEVGLDWWALVPRGDLIFVIGLLLLLPPAMRRLHPETRWAYAAMPLVASLSIAAVVGCLAIARDVHDVPGSLPGIRQGPTSDTALMADGDWPAYAGTWHGNKYSPLAQINPLNVGKLKVAWAIHTGDTKRAGDPDETTYEVTPIKVGNTLYMCTPHNVVLALDPDTGRELWRFDPKVQVPKHVQHLTCRGVSWFDASTTGKVSSECPQRLFVATNDSRLIALNPRSGTVCRSFGTNGVVSLLEGQSHYNDGWYQYTSAPLIARNLVVLGGAVFDNASVDVPAGVIRAYDGITGRLVWNFDPGRPNDTTPLKAGAHYTPSTPNMWSTPAADERLGLIYLPIGMGAVDQWGGRRPATTERFATSVLALEIETGRLRWKYQTVHHDLWDMDVPAQPALVDLTLPGKGRVPALVQSTKTGNLFVLDRRTGLPLLPAPERAVPQGAAPGDWVSTTQPFSSMNLMPKLATERKMWGATMVDQLWCRIRFKSLRYEGPFTPPSLKGTLVFPGNFGVMDWGGMSIDPARQVAFAHPNYIAFVDRLVPRAEGGSTGSGGPAGGSDRRGSSEKGYNPNTGAPFAVDMNPFLSPLGLPCQQPPWGYVAGVDLVSGKIAWQHRNGNIRMETPLIPLPFTLGVPSLGGPMMTAGGVAFMSSAIDDYVRAYNVSTGKVLWSASLPAGGQATPMTYLGRNGRQYVIVVAGGHGSLGTKLGDNVIAYAL
ncbi:membrane-bound PQQ-dependent dehydrogenase, glucose/quinate/shikimate family [Sphingomonas sp. BIUV-7]|uniref:Membrane-bound PQQ-dependent dehydrogenase, glucose/quinate/shikimate family n=1 Tax=Sphingomonas natans TaxID=3063330 RepID=A0ABT8Y790_9SPHN|nr:membrane-bound PQQ-dependent dehydrogenase, glucose/quinate/shikimate family [Sphingomonas sp. BIUV-7]MDO6414190.1 membrane-bound PQQ-dependent dehydrogenase, glucose/quinate/shikimate family [Sphingomonas sp. BIUV-7]